MRVEYDISLRYLSLLYGGGETKYYNGLVTTYVTTLKWLAILTTTRYRKYR